MNFAIRQLTKDDWEILKQIRLEALTLHANFFYTTSDEFKFTEAEWKERLSNPDGAHFGLFNDKNAIIGLTGIFRDSEDRTLAWMVSSYLKAEYRRQGLTRFLYEARIKWAKEQNDIHTLIIHQRADNEISKKSNQKFNFQYVKTYPPADWPNGEVVPYAEYILRIK